MNILPPIKRNFLALLAIMWSCSIAGCRDFKDHRTPYKSFVQIVFKPINKDDKLTITAIATPTTREKLVVDSLENPKMGYCNLPLDPNAYFVQLDIHTTPTAPTETLKIYYQREAVLISHQCGGAYKYTIKKIESTPGIKLKVINKNKALSTFNDSHTDVQVYL